MENGRALDSVVVIGTGQAGFQAACSLREAGYRGALTLLGDDPFDPYQRPPLSKAFMTGGAHAAALQLRPASYYADQRIVLRAATRAVSIDRAARRVELASGERLPYDHLVLATGTRNRTLPVPGADLDGVFQLRTLSEAAAIRSRSVEARRMAVIGGGFIGLEFAATAAAASKAVTVVESADRLMSRAVSRTLSGFLRETHERAGIDVVLDARVTRIRGAGGKVIGVETGEGRVIEADLVLVGIGVVPNGELAAGAGLDVADGIRVDDHLVTSDPDISAIGDCAVFPSPASPGEFTRIESVQNALDQARCVAARLTGRPAPYGAVPWFWSDQGEVRLQIAGLSDPRDAEVTRGVPASGRFSVFRFRDGSLTGVESVNRAADHIAARRLLAERIPLTPEEIADPSFDLRSLRQRSAAA